MTGHHDPDLSHLTPLFLALHIPSQVGLAILILTFLFAKNISRHPTLINFCFSWVIYSLSYCILIYSGKKASTSPPGIVCRAQAALIHGAPTMASVAGLAVVVQIWSTLRAPEHWSTSTGPQWPWSTSLTLTLALPYVVFFAFTTASAVLGNKYPETVDDSNGLYCTIHKSPFRLHGVPLFTAAVLALVIGFEVAMGIRYCRLWTRISNAFPLADRRPSMSLVLRVTLFNFYSLIALTSSVFFLSDTLIAWPYMVCATIPLGAVLVFGTQKLGLIPRMGCLEA